MTPEGKVKKMTTDLLKQFKAHYFMPVSNGMGRAGVSDIIGCHKGRYFAIETKSATGKPTPLQMRFLTEVVESGGVGFIVRDAESLKEVEKWLCEDCKRPCEDCKRPCEDCNCDEQYEQGRQL